MLRDLIELALLIPFWTVCFVDASYFSRISISNCFGISFVRLDICDLVT